MFEIKLEGLDRLRSKLDRAASRQTLIDASREALTFVLENMPPYPTPSRRPMQFVSERQRRYVMMLVREGKVPYQRTGDIEDSFVGKIHGVGNDVVASITNASAHAPYVIDRRRQARYHSGTWWTLQDVIGRMRGKVAAIYRRHYTLNVFRR